MYGTLILSIKYSIEVVIKQPGFVNQQVKFIVTYFHTKFIMTYFDLFNRQFYVTVKVISLQNMNSKLKHLE